VVVKVGCALCARLPAREETEETADQLRTTTDKIGKKRNNKQIISSWGTELQRWWFGGSTTTTGSSRKERKKNLKDLRDAGGKRGKACRCPVEAPAAVTAAANNISKSRSENIFLHGGASTGSSTTCTSNNQQPTPCSDHARSADCCYNRFRLPRHATSASELPGVHHNCPATTTTQCNLYSIIPYFYWSANARSPLTGGSLDFIAH
jgi:hypothetical protein